MPTNPQIDQSVKKALESVLASDAWLLVNDLSEQSISHRLAYFLQPLFEGYNVDCEYNGDIDRPNDKKAISILKSELEQFGLLREKEANDLERELTNRAVFPDIIIHKRGTNDDNLCILEIKKSTSKVDYEYDFVKLRSYTSNQYGNTLKYQLGIFIEVKIDSANPSFNLRYYKDGHEIDQLD